MAATAAPMSTPAAVFSGMLRTPVSLEGNSGAVFDAVDAATLALWVASPPSTTAAT